MSDAIEVKIRGWVSPFCPVCRLEVPKGPAIACNGSLYHVGCYAEPEPTECPVCHKTPCEGNWGCP